MPRSPGERFAAAGTPRRADRARLAAALRRAVSAAVGTRAAEGTLDEAIARAEALAALLEGHARPSRYDPGDGLDLVGGGDDVLASHPVVGGAHPIAPPLRIEPVAGGVRASVTYGVQYEGLPGLVHGGFVSLAFDTVLLLAGVVAGHAGVTGSLTVRYRRPTPLHAALVYVGELARVEGRHGRLVGRLCGPDGEVCAEGEAVSVLVDPERFRATG